MRAAPDYLEAGEIEGALSQLARRLRVAGTADPGWGGWTGVASGSVFGAGGSGVAAAGAGLGI